MPWEKNFNRDEALGKAMLVFWRLGYDNTPVGELVKATSASRYGLYDEFGDKEGLFLEALDEYSKTIVRPRLTEMMSAGAGVKSIEAYFQALARKPKKELDGLGCLMCLTAVDFARHNKSASVKVNSHFSLLHKAFLNALSKNFSASKLNQEKMAHFFVGLVQGGAVLSRARVSQEARSAYYETGLSVLH